MFATMNMYKLERGFVHDEGKCGDIMLAKIELRLKSSEKIAYQMSSLFHGALMEMLPMDYAEYLHLSQLHPYTQHLECRDREWYWIVSCLNQEAVQKIIKEVLWTLESIEIKKQKIHMKTVAGRFSVLHCQK